MDETSGANKQLFDAVDIAKEGKAIQASKICPILVVI